MTDLARNGSVLVAEIKAGHASAADGTNGSVPHANGDAALANGTVPASTGADAAAAPLDPSVTHPYVDNHPSDSAGHAAEAPALTAGTGAHAVPHQADPSIATGVVSPAGGETAAPAEEAAAPGLIQPQTSAIQPLQPSDNAREVSHINTAVPAAFAGVGAGAAGAAAAGHHSAAGSAVEPTSAVSGGNAPDSAVSPQQHQQFDTPAPGSSGIAPGSIVSPQQQQELQQPQQQNSVAPVAAAVPIVAHPGPTTVAAQQTPKSALSPKEIKKMDKLMRKEAKDEHKSLKRAIKDAQASEKLFRKSRDAEQQSIKRHTKAQTNEHKASKALSKAKAEHEKYAADLAKSIEDLDIKKRHTEGTRSGYEEAKKRIDELRNQKTVNDQARSRQAAQLHGAR